VLIDYAENPYPYLDEAGKKKIAMAQSDLLRKFTDLAFDDSAKTRWLEAEQKGADGMDLEAKTELELESGLFERSENSF